MSWRGPSSESAEDAEDGDRALERVDGPAPIHGMARASDASVVDRVLGGETRPRPPMLLMQGRLFPAMAKETTGDEKGFWLWIEDTRGGTIYRKRGAMFRVRRAARSAALPSSHPCACPEARRGGSRGTRRIRFKAPNVTTRWARAVARGARLISCFRHHNTSLLTKNRKRFRDDKTVGLRRHKTQ